MSELEQARPTSVMDPLTGELVELDAPLEVLAQAIDDVNQRISMLKAFKGDIDVEILARMDHNGLWTEHAGEWKIKSVSPDRTEVDAERVAQCLRPFVNVPGGISEKAYEQAVWSEEIWKSDRRVLNRLKKLGGKIKAAVVECEVPVKGKRYVQVTREL